MNNDDHENGGRGNVIAFARQQPRLARHSTLDGLAGFATRIAAALAGSTDHVSRHTDTSSQKKQTTPADCVGSQHGLSAGKGDRA